MIELIGRRACLILLTSLLLGAIFGLFHNSASQAQIGPEEPILYEDGGGGGGGGGAGAYCPIPSVVVGGRTCTASGCKVYSPSYPVFVCNYRGSDGSSSGCPPLEQCQ